jgi:BirA family biotin operon repressor/biotin-[acetyl-CoA-carboxylase] ligase
MTCWPVANPWSAPVFYVESTPSTMEEARRLDDQGFPSGTVVAAGYQQRGRGRRPGRAWAAEPGKNLLFTLLLDLDPGFPPQRLPLLAGLALARTVEDRFGLEVEVKWPNDLLCGQRKLAGVLCLARSRASIAGFVPRPPAPSVRALVGVGVNCNQLEFPAQLRACSLAGLLGREVALPGLLADILAALRAALDDGDWRSGLQRRLYGAGREATLRPEGEGAPIVARVLGVARDGALLLESGGEVRRVYSGELLFQPEAQREGDRPAAVQPGRGREARPEGAGQHVQAPAETDHPHPQDDHARGGAGGED